MELLDAVLAENEQLRMRIAALESGLAEYRRQMDEVLSSSSWRVTSPLRVASGQARRFRRIPRKWRRRPTGGARPASVIGLFPPAEVDPANATAVAALGTSPAQIRHPRDAQAVLSRRARVLVVAHIFYPEVWPDIASRLSRMPEDFDLLVTLVADRADWLTPEIVGQFPQARIEIVENRGRDIWPLVSLANRGYFHGYDAILKVHSKRSPHRIDGDGWRIRLLDALLASPAAISHMIELLRRDADVGVIVPEGHVSGPEHWGSDLPFVEALAARLPMAFDPEELRFAAGSMFWCRPWVLQRLADLALTSEDFPDEAGQTDATTAHAIERMVGVISAASGLSLVTTDEVPSALHRVPTRQRPKVLAFYLPQYHQIPENDEWWGEGFTDWTNVRVAKPLFTGHAQPRVPGELGEYDLADPGVMRSQAALAQQYGIDGMIMYHYWFNGRRLLEKPLENLLADPSIDMPFALCWANENWTRRWDGLSSHVLVEQSYASGWDERFLTDILPALRDPRYITVDGRPLLVLYRVGLIPDAAAVIGRWRTMAAAEGLGGLHVLAVTPSRDFEGMPADISTAIDGLIRFPPGSGIGLQSIVDAAPGYDTSSAGDVMSYDAAVDGADLLTRSPQGLRVHPGVMPGWDNTPRRGSAAWAFHGGNPLSFRRWMRLAGRMAAASGDNPMVFVNAWNEWAEGAYLEPDVRFGRGYLEAVADALPRPRADRAESTASSAPVVAGTGGGV